MFIYQYIISVFFFYEKLDIIYFYFSFNFSNFLQENYIYRNVDIATIIIFYIKVGFPTYKLYIYILIFCDPYSK